ncbi:hypothetical protein NUW58_g6486 [Xylaria curta]|uniref:Uncharacterized protein n=1 Tax=Xylaria curta TaxID=42375 RepID=A0ACC1NUT3_9PEZI|nr:hypothetical protein NUW58_g6486 [Xylaria curta]
MSFGDNTIATSSPSSTEQDRTNTVMAALPPTEPQSPTSTAADAHNASILTVRGLHTTSTGHELHTLAYMAACDYEIPGHGITVTFEPFYFFFYGSLQIPNVLRRVCQIDDQNTITMIKDARIRGWKIKMWGPYPALVPAAKDHEVQGVAWLCNKSEHVARLSTYETAAYRMAYCDVSIPSADGEGVDVIKNARTFVSTEDPITLEDGRFDVAEYENSRLGMW